MDKPRKNWKSPNFGNTFLTASVSLVFAVLIWSSVHSKLFHFSWSLCKTNQNHNQIRDQCWDDIRFGVSLQIVFVIIFGKSCFDEPLIEDQIQSSLHRFVGSLIQLFSRWVKARDLDVSLFSANMLSNKPQTMRAVTIGGPNLPDTPLQRYTHRWVALYSNRWTFRRL